VRCRRGSLRDILRAFLSVSAQGRWSWSQEPLSKGPRSETAVSCYWPHSTPPPTTGVFCNVESILSFGVTKSIHDPGVLSTVQTFCPVQFCPLTVEEDESHKLASDCYSVAQAGKQLAALVPD
jgi:hypothetical protein